nr:hypothetical protein [uncultured Campylobacter sp.]
MQNQDKIGIKFYAERANAKSVNFTLKNPCGEISPLKARPKLTRRVPKNQKAAAAKSSR